MCGSRREPSDSRGRRPRRARLDRDPALPDRMLVRGTVRCWRWWSRSSRTHQHHCAQAFLPPELWDPTTWRPGDVPSPARIAHRLDRRGERLEDIERYYGEQHMTGLYPRR